MRFIFYSNMFSITNFSFLYNLFCILSNDRYFYIPKWHTLWLSVQVLCIVSWRKVKKRKRTVTNQLFIHHIGKDP